MTRISVPWAPKRTIAPGFLGRTTISAAKVLYEALGPIVARSAGIIMIAAVVGSCLLVWLHALLFSYVDDRILAQASTFELGARSISFWSPSTWGLTPTMIAAAMGTGFAAGGGGPGLLGYVLWPLQFGILRDLLVLGAIFGFFNIVPAFAIWWERKVAGRIQSRLGPMRVGGWHGWAQSPADGIKLVLKEDLVPGDADGPLFRVAPYFAIIPSFLAYLALPFGSGYVFREMDVAVVFILGVLGIEVISVILAGWGSNNKWSIYGAMREACQMVSYEIPMGMALLVPVLCAGTLNLRAIGEFQSGGWFSWIAFQNPFAFVAFVTYFIAALASCKRAPFDLPESESELVAGFLTEYTGFRWALFFFAEYAAMFVVCALCVLLFLGGWNSPFPAHWGDGLGDGILAQGIKGLIFGGPIWFILKCVFFIYVQMWLRWTLPRIRIDQVLYACVQVLLPLTMVLVLGAALWVWASSSGSAGWAGFAGFVNWVLGIAGLVVAMGFPTIAAYGFYHRRRLVGNLVVDAKPGS